MKKRFVPTLIVFTIFIVLLVYVNIHEVSEIPEPGKDLPVDLAKISLNDVKSITWKNFDSASQNASAPKTEPDSEVKVEARKEYNRTNYYIVKPREFRGENSEIE